jgi:hypothetical protein
MWGLCEDGVLWWDIDPTAVSQSGSDPGQPLVSGHIIMSGGPKVNGPVKYYEANKIAPVYFKAVSGSYTFFSTEGTPGTGDDVQIAGAALTFEEHSIQKDMFVIELFQIGDGPDYAVIIYGFGGRGTLAGAVYFKTVIEPDLSSYTRDYYIVQWDDTNNNGHPDIPGTDTYTAISPSP